MHLLALSWDVERPGWLAPGVHGLARAVQRHGSSCEVVALGPGPASTRTVDGVAVTWVGEAPPVLPPAPAYDMARVLATASRASAVAERCCQAQVPDVVLAYGWHTAWTATTVRASRGIPLVALLDSTAPGRAAGPLDDTGRMAAQVEWWLTYEARRVVAPSHHVAGQLRRSYRLPAAKVDVVAPGVTLPPRPTVARTGEVAVLGPAPVVHRVRRALGPARVRTDRDALARAEVAVVFDDHDVEGVLAAMAAGAVVVVPEDGPLRGLVHAGRSGVRVARDPRAVAGAVRELFDTPARCARIGDRARARLAQRHAWPDVAAQHLQVAARAIEQEADLAAAPARPLRPMLLRSPLLGLVGEVPTTPPIGRHRARGRG